MDESGGASLQSSPPPHPRMTSLLEGTFHAAPSVVGHSPAFQQLMRLVERVARTDRSVLITGPTGAGKEVVAQRIHHRGPMAHAPFIDVNCGALPENLVEAELFGHARGAFTGAVSHHAGHFERVGAGTLFLDEVGELPLSLQPKLLRVLETRSFRPVGSTEVRRFHGRVVAASHRDLAALVREGRFREDLYYRLAVFEVRVPALAERRADIPDLVRHFASLQPRPLSFGADALGRLQNHDWPGNIRELRSLVDRLGVLADEPHITAASLDAFLPPPALAGEHNPLANPMTLADALLALPGEDKLALAEQLLVERAMALSRDNKSAAARILGVSRKAVERRVAAQGQRLRSPEDCLAAANGSIAEAAFAEALAPLRSGLSQVRADATEPEERRLCYELNRQLGVCLRSLNGWLDAEAQSAYEAAFQAGQGVVSEVEMCSLLFGIWTTQLMAMDLPKARGTVQEMLQRAQAGGDPELVAEAHVAMANTLFWLGDGAEALACLYRGGLVPVGAQERCRTQGFDLIGLALNIEGLSAFQTGDFERARQALLRLRERADHTVDHPLNQAIALQGGAWLACLFGELDTLGALSQRLVDLALAHGFVFYLGVGQVLLGAHLTVRGQADAAEVALREGFETHMLRNGGQLFHSFQAWKLGELWLQNGKADACDRMIGEALEVALTHQDRAYLAELLDVQGRARQALGDAEGAEEALRSALSTATALGSVPGRVLAATHLAQLLAGQGRRQAATDVLVRALKGLSPTVPYLGVGRAFQALASLQRERVGS